MRIKVHILSVHTKSVINLFCSVAVPMGAAGFVSQYHGLSSKWYCLAAGPGVTEYVSTQSSTTLNEFRSL